MAATPVMRSSQQLAAHALQHIIASAWTRESAGEIRHLNNLVRWFVCLGMHLCVMTALLCVHARMGYAAL